MVLNERAQVRQLAFIRFLKVRKQEPKGKLVRIFQQQITNFVDSNYIELIDWSKCKPTLPPIMNYISTQSLEEDINTNVLS